MKAPRSSRRARLRRLLTEVADPRRNPPARACPTSSTSSANGLGVRLAVAALLRDASRVRGAVPRLALPHRSRVLRRQARARRRLRHGPPRVLRRPLRCARGRRSRPERRRRGGTREPRPRSRTCTSCRATSCGCRSAPLRRVAASTSSTRSACFTTCPIRTRGSGRSLPYLRPGGTIAVWLYGYENNGFVRHVVEPLRKVTTRMSRPSPPRGRVAARRRLPRRSPRASTDR